MLKRFFFSICLLPVFLCANVYVPAFADNLSEGLELYHAKKYKEAIPLLERAANEGHEKAIEALDQIYAQNPKLSATSVNPIAKKDKGSDASASTADKDNTASESNEEAKSNFRRKVIAIAIAIGLVAAWFIHRKILRKRKAQAQDKKSLM